MDIQKIIVLFLLLVLFLLVTYAPLMAVLTYPAMEDSSGVSSWSGSQLERRAGLLMTSLKVSALAAVLAFVFGTPAGMALSRFRIPFRRLLLPVSCFLLLIPPYLTTVALLQLFGARGALTALFPSVFAAWDPYQWWMASVMIAWWCLPLVAVSTWMVLRFMPPELEEWAMLHTGTWKTLLRVTFPQALEGGLLGGVLTFLLAWTNFEIPDFLRVRVYAAEVFSQFSAFYQLHGAVSASLPLLIGTAMAGLTASALHGKLVPVLAGSELYDDKPLWSKGWLNRLTAYLIAVFIVLFVGLPVGILFYRSLPLEVYALTWESVKPELALSLRTSILAGVFSCVVGWGMACLIVPKPDVERRWLELFCLIPLAVPAPIVGIGLIRLWNRGGWPGWVYRHETIIILAACARFMPLAVLTWVRGMRRVPAVLHDLACLDGAGWMTWQSRIILPLCGRFALIALILVFAFSMGELGAAVLVVPPGDTTVSVRIYTLLHYGADSMVAALCVILFLIVTGTFLILAAFSSGWRLRAKRV